MAYVVLRDREPAHIFRLAPMRTLSSTFFLLAILPCLAAAARGIAKPWETPLMDSIHATVAMGDLRTADSLVRSHAQEIMASNARDGYAVEAVLFLTGDLDSLLSLAGGGRFSVHPLSPRDPDLGMVLGYEEEEINRKIDLAFGNAEAAATLILLRQAMTDFAAEDRMDLPYDPDWFYTWKPSPTRLKINAKVLEHLAEYGSGPYARTLGENVYFLVGKYKVPMGINMLEGGGWMDGKDAGPIWWRSTSFLFEYRFMKGFIYLKFGRAVGGLGLAHHLLDTRRFVLSPYAGIAQYPFVTLGEYKNVRQYSGPDLGLSLDWKFRSWESPRSSFNLYLRTNTGIVMDPKRLSRDLLRTSFVYLNMGLGVNLDMFARYTPYVCNGKVKLHREFNW